MKARKLTESRKGHDARRLRPLRELVCTAQILQQPGPNNGLCQQQIPNQPGPPPPEPALQQLRLQHVSSACILSFIIIKSPLLKQKSSPSLTPSLSRKSPKNRSQDYAPNIDPSNDSPDPAKATLSTPTWTGSRPPPNQCGNPSAAAKASAAKRLLPAPNAPRCKA